MLVVLLLWWTIFCRNLDTFLRMKSTSQAVWVLCPSIVWLEYQHSLCSIWSPGPPFGTQKLVPTLFLIHIFGKRASFQEAPWNEHIFFRAHLFLFSLCFYMTQLFWSVWFLSCWRDAGSTMLSHAWTKNKSNMHWYALVNLSNCTVNRMLTGWGQFVYLLFAQRVKG
jgi:hypothetical protein